MLETVERLVGYRHSRDGPPGPDAAVGPRARRLSRQARPCRMPAAERLVEDARALEQAGAFAVVLESIPEAWRSVTSALSIPTIGIGAGPHCDGQVLVCYDAFGIVRRSRAAVRQAVRAARRRAHRRRRSIRRRRARGPLSGCRQSAPEREMSAQLIRTIAGRARRARRLRAARRKAHRPGPHHGRAARRARPPDRNRARRECATVVVSVFVNPIQFNRSDDFERYPRVLEADLRFAGERGADLVFAPDNAEMYPRQAAHVRRCRGARRTPVRQVPARATSAASPPW